MKKQIRTISIIAFFFLIGIIILIDQFLKIKIWFQLEDLHHETFAISSFVFAIGILIGSILKKNG